MIREETLFKMLHVCFFVTAQLLHSSSDRHKRAQHISDFIKIYMPNSLTKLASHQAQTLECVMLLNAFWSLLHLYYQVFT